MKQGDCCYFVLVNVKRNIIVQFLYKCNAMCAECKTADTSYELR